ncbi:MAG: hypothetical protein B7Z02_00010 [Rhodobacterales bacterium 32-67-9]|nr:MAG: hypothetical protein B7Z02_00010 [Rhodobacterales bacterium 32-67-9]
MSVPAIAFETYQALVSEIHAAGLDPGRWQSVLATLSRAAGGICTHMFGYDRKVSTSNLSYDHGYAPEFTESFFAYYRTMNAWAPGFAAHPVGVTVASGKMISDDALKRTEFYADWVRPQENIIGGGGAILMKDHDRLYMIGGNIRAVDRERLEHRWLDLVSLCVPHIQQALAANRMLAGLRLDRHLLRQGCDTDGAAVFVVTKSRRVALTNPPAERLIASGEIAQVDAIGRLQLTDSRGDLALERLLCDAHGTASLLLADPEPGGAHYVCRAMPIGEDALQMLPPPHNWFADPPMTAIIVRRRNQEADPALRIARKLGITPSEAAVSLYLVDGLALRDIAEARGVSLHTVRNQIKSAMMKLTLRRQSDLILAVDRAGRAPEFEGQSPNRTPRAADCVPGTSVTGFGISAKNPAWRPKRECPGENRVQTRNSIG